MARNKQGNGYIWISHAMKMFNLSKSDLLHATKRKQLNTFSIKGSNKTYVKESEMRRFTSRT